jgi:ferrous iron transport protein B
VKGYIERAGTMIFAASLLVWFILNFNMDGRAADVSMSFGAQLGKFAVPFLEPLGLGSWQLAVALFSGLAAKEVVVASLSVLFGIVNVNSALGMRDMADVLGAQGFGILNAYAMMVFCLLYTPCVATLGVIRKETGSVKMMAGVMLFQLAVAWCVTFLVYNIGRIFF